MRSYVIARQRIKAGDGNLPAFEHTPLSLAKTAFLTGGGANSGVLDAWRKFQDPDLSQITAAWPALPEHIKAAILKMVKDAVKQS